MNQRIKIVTVFICSYLVFMSGSLGQVCTLNQLPANLQTGLNAYFPFCNNLDDISGNGRNGTLNGAVPFVNDRFGNPASALQLGSGKITIPSAAFNYQWDAEFSLSFWFTNTTGIDYQRLISTECPEGNFRIAGTTIGGNYVISFGDVTNYIYDSQPLNQWTHVVYVYSRRNVSVYINGQLKYKVYNNSTEALNYCNPFTIGAKAGTNVDYWGGSFDDLYIYSRALQPCEVLQLYAATQAAVPGYQEIPVDLFPDTLRVCGNSTALNLPSGYNYYLWSTGDTAQTLTVTRSGLYAVRVGNSLGCGRDSTYVALVNSRIINNDTLICKGQGLQLISDTASENSPCSYAGLPANLRSGIVAYFPFCGSAADAGPNSFATTVSGVSFGPDRFGKPASAGVFSSANKSKVEIPANPLLEPASFTVTAWFKTNVIQAGGLGSGLAQQIVNYSPQTWAKGTAYCLDLLITDNSVLQGRFWNSTTFWQFLITNPGTITTNQWYFAAMTFDQQTGLQNLYVNGQLVNTKTSVHTYEGQIAFLIGATYESLTGIATDFFQGSIDDVGFWNRALSATEITQLYNYSGSQSNSYTWSTGQTGTVITVNPQQTTKYYLTVSDGITSCIDSVKITVAVPDTSIQALDPLQLCASGGAFSRLQAASGMSAYQWLKDGVVIPGAVSWVYPATQTGVYRVIIKNSLGCQDTSRAVTITFYLLPTGQFLTPAVTDICEGSSLSLTASGAASYQWFRNGILIPGSVSATYAATVPGTYTVNFVSAQGCITPSGKNVTLALLARPRSSFVYDTYCEGVSSAFTSTATITNSGPVTLKWLFDDGSSQTGSAVSHQFLRSGPYSVKLVVTPLACPANADTATSIISVQKPLTGIRYATVNGVLNKPVTINARAIGQSWLWTPAVNLSDPRVRSPLLTPKQEQQYLVRITNSAGCTTTDSLLVHIFDDRNIYVAGGFTPNNDGKNDRLYPIPVGIAEFRYLRIYNRWGNLVFQTSSIQPQDGWDGTFNGKAQPSDTYTWIAEGIDVDGKLVKRTGSTILIR